MNSSEQINELATALAKAQGEITGAIRDSTNPHFRSKYADLSSVWEAIRLPFSRHGLSVVQGLASAEGGVSCETRLLHTSGQWIASTLTIPADKLNAHGYGSACTYARRFGLQAMAGIAPIDDDGNAAVAAAPVTATPQENTLANKIAQAMIEYHDKGDVFAALQEWQDARQLGQDVQVSIWSILKPRSDVRSAIKKAEATAKETA